MLVTPCEKQQGHFWKCYYEFVFASEGDRIAATPINFTLLQLGRIKDGCSFQVCVDLNFQTKLGTTFSGGIQGEKYVVPSTSSLLHFLPCFKCREGHGN